MAYPFFSLSKTHRTAPIDFVAGDVSIRVEAVPDHGMATIWDADILIWAASQIVEARDQGLRTSRLMAATPYEILNFIGRGVSLRDYQRLKAALDRLQSTTVATSIRQPAEGRRHRFSWINEWQERTDRNGRPAVFRPHRRPRPMALPHRAQAWRQAAQWLALRLPTPLSEIRQPLALQALHIRAARHHPASAAPRLHPVSRGRNRRSPAARLRAHTALWTNCGRPRAIRNSAYRAIGNRSLVLSGTQTGYKLR